MNILPRLVAIATLGLGAVFAASSAAAADEAKVVKLTGSATMTLPGQAPVALDVGTMIPKGATITTDSTGEVYVETIPGAIASIKPDSKVLVEEIAIERSGDTITSQTSTLDLQEGDIVSTIDPSKMSINHYAIRTAKGVAAARGTGYSVSVHAGGLSIAATADNVTFTTAGGTSYSISAGMISITEPNGVTSAPVSLASAAASNPNIARIMNEAVKTIDAVVSSNLGNIGAAASTNLISQVVAVASAANPAGAAAYTSSAITAVSASGSSTGGATATAVAAVTAAAVTAVPSDAANIAGAAAKADPSQAAVVAAAAATAAPSQGASIAGSVATAVPASSGAITSAVEQATGSTSTTIAQAVATATGQTVQQVQQSATQATTAGSQAAQNANNVQQTVVQPVVPTVVSPSS